MTTAGTASVTQRLEHLERQNRWPKLAGVAVLTLAGALVVMGQASPQRDIRAESFTVVDANGVVQGRLLALPGGGSALTLAVADVEGPTASLVVERTGAILFVANGSEERNASGALAASKEGVVMDFLDPNGKQRVVLTHTGLRLFDANERPIWDAP